MTDRFLPYSRQVIEDDDIAAVAEVLRSDFLTTGPAVEAFEAAAMEATGAAHAVVVTSGTAALHIAVLAAGCGPGKTWIVPAVSFVATANAVRYCGGEVIFADVDPETALMRPGDLEAALERARREGHTVQGVLPVHMGGQTGDLGAIRDIATRHRLIVVEDAAHAFGGTFRHAGATHRVGGCALSEMTMLSLHPVKTVTMGEGGVVTTNDPQLAALLARARAHGIARDPALFRQPDLANGPDGSVNPWYYEQIELGYNYRATDIQCALGISQLKKLDRFVEGRAAIRALYPELLPEGVRLVPQRGDQHPGWHLAVALIDFASAGIDRGSVMRRLRERGIGTQVHYIPIHLQPYYRERYGHADLPGAMSYYERCLSLPLFGGMSRDDVARVAVALAEVLQ